MDEAPWPLRPLQAGKPIVALIGVDLQELPAEAPKEAFGMLMGSLKNLPSHDSLDPGRDCTRQTSLRDRKGLDRVPAI
jgi:hypothetical protein